MHKKTTHTWALGRRRPLKVTWALSVQRLAVLVIMKSEQKDEVGEKKKQKIQTGGFLYDYCEVATV